VPLSHTIIYVVGSLYLALYFSLRVQDKIINFRVECSNISCRRTKGLIRRSLTYGFQSSGKLILNGLFKKLVNGTFCIRPGNNQLRVVQKSADTPFQPQVLGKRKSADTPFEPEVLGKRKSNLGGSDGSILKAMQMR
jgi:hypothetical protein